MISVNDIIDIDDEMCTDSIAFFENTSDSSVNVARGRSSLRVVKGTTSRKVLDVQVRSKN